ncbi:MipA/OmpV family protein [Motilimonas sp. KMU-193]|uniref:MipA/OmpV family protein n=1 Tax=Motilimonas sp. KMU-193 TaxID=3388668 RepID=UPI00396AF2C1
MERLLLLIVILSSHSYAVDYAEKAGSWGVGIGIRDADIPFATTDKRVQDVMPLLFYQGDKFYLDGMTSGYQLYQHEDVSAGFVGRFRFFDLPKESQNELQGFSMHFGGDVQWRVNQQLKLSWEVLSDEESRFHSNLRVETHFKGADWDLTPYLVARYKTERFNEYYYGLKQYNLNSGVDWRIGAKGRYQVYQNLYLMGHLGASRLEKDVYQHEHIRSSTQLESYIGIGLFNQPGQAGYSQLGARGYFRLAHGWATPSNIGDIFSFNREKDPYNNQLTSLFYGHPIADTLFDWPLDLYLTGGLVHHHKSDVQGPFPEYVVAIKAYYTLQWPVRWRLGFAEGLSYSSKISYVEQSEMDRKDYNPSNLLNYLDFSADLNVGDLVGRKELNALWLGYSLHHRSGIFSSSSAFGRIKGGSNYNTVYLQWDF